MPFLATLHLLHSPAKRVDESGSQRTPSEVSQLRYQGNALVQTDGSQTAGSGWVIVNRTLLSSA
jgi:hypothetical protein